MLYIWIFSTPLETLAPEEPVMSPQDMTEPEKVLGWEVLDSEETERQTQVREESSGLVKAIVGVLHKG